jgi:CTP synthase
MRMSMARNDSLCVHVVFLPHIGATGELKTKPIQHSVRDLRGIGIQPQVIIARTDYPVGKDIIEKISLFCDVDKEAVIPLETTDLLYDVPLTLEEYGLGEYLVEQLQLDTLRPALDDWRTMIQQMRAAEKPVRIAVVGKYVELHDAYMSVKEALFHAASSNDARVEIEWLYSGDLEKDKGWDVLERADGIVVPGGFGYRGFEGKVQAARFARENKVPYLGLCLGMQAMCIEFGRNVAGLENANSSEFDTTPHPVIDLMLEQRGITEMGGTMRLGTYPCHLLPGSAAASAYDDAKVVYERHRHRFEFNNVYRAQFERLGMVFSGLSPDGQLVEISEIKDHPFMVGSQFHPEFLSRPNLAHPLFSAFIDAALDYHASDQHHTAMANGYVPDETELRNP